MGVPFDDWFQGCGFQFYHNTDRYGQFANHVFAACDNDISEIVQGLTGCDEDAIRSAGELLSMDQSEYAFIGYDDDAVNALQKCIDKMRSFKARLDERMSKEYGI